MEDELSQLTVDELEEYCATSSSCYDEQLWERMVRNNFSDNKIQQTWYLTYIYLLKNKMQSTLDNIQRQYYASSAIDIIVKLVPYDRLSELGQLLGMANTILYKYEVYPVLQKMKIPFSEQTSESDIKSRFFLDDTIELSGSESQKYLQWLQKKPTLYYDREGDTIVLPDNTDDIKRLQKELSLPGIEL